MGHEMGHYVLGHAWWGVAILTLLTGIGLFLVAWLSPKILARAGPRWNVRGVDDPAVVPLFMIVLTVYFFAMTPALNSMVRIFESQADAFGLDAARQPDGFASIAMKLSQYRKIEPSPVEEFVFFDHPSGRTRVRMAMDWKAEHVEDPEMVVPEPAD